MITGLTQSYVERRGLFGVLGDLANPTKAYLEAAAVSPVAAGYVISQNKYVQAFYNDSDVLLGYSDRELSANTQLALDMAEETAVHLSLAFAAEALEWANKTDGDYAELIGQIHGIVAFEIASALVLRGAGQVARFSKLAKVIDDIPGLSLATKTKLQGIIRQLEVRIAYLTKTQVCFVAGTQVHTKEGLKVIEEIQPGDLVLTRDEHAGNAESQPVYRQVTQVFETNPDQLYHVTFQRSDGNEETLSTTLEHPFYVIDREAFVAAQDLSQGDQFLLADGSTATITGLRIELAKTGTFTTYNFEVSGTHTYFVGESGVWVHNTGNDVCLRLADSFRKNIDRGLSEAKAISRMRETLRRLDITDAEKQKHFIDALDKLVDEGSISRELAERSKLTKVGAPKRLTHSELAGDVPHTQSVSRMARKFKRGEFEPTKRDLGIDDWDEVLGPGKGLSIDGVMGRNPALQGEPYTALAGRISEASGGKLKAVFRPTAGNPNHVQIEAVGNLTGKEFRDLMRKLFKDGVWE